MPRGAGLSGGRALVLVNRNASRSAESAGTALEALSARGLSLDLHFPEDGAAMRRLAEERAAAADLVVIAGGDGTVNAVLPALVAAGRPVGILPLGTANDLALTLGIPADPVEAAAVIAGGRSHAIDIGRVNDIPFVNVASFGLSVSVADHLDAGRKRQWRVFSYVMAALEALGEADLFHARLVADERSFEVDAYQVAVGNGVYYGGGMAIAENAAIDDGWLDVYAIETRSVLELAALTPALRAGTLGDDDHVTAFRTRTLRIETDSPMPINTDGEVTTRTPADFRVERGALTVLVPERSS